MKTKLYLSIILLGLFFSVCEKGMAQSPAFEWAKGIGTAYYDYATSVAIDSFGNTYIGGELDNTIFIYKLDTNGDFVWTRIINSNSLWPCISIDKFSNIYITSTYTGTVDFDPDSLGVFNLTGNKSMFVLKLDSAGKFIWAKSIDSPIGYPYSHSITNDTNSNVYLTGYIDGPTDFDPGIGIFILTPVDQKDIFISKLDSSGNFIWAKQLGDIKEEISYSVAVDPVGNIYTTGTFEGTVDFNPDTGVSYNLTSAGFEDIFISKLDNLGNFLWAKRVGAGSGEFGQSIAVDGLGNAYIIGSFGGIVDFNPGIDTFNLVCANNRDIFILKLDSLGDFTWAKRIGGNSSNYNEGYSIALDSYCNVYSTGYYQDDVDFNPDSLINNTLYSDWSPDVFILKLDSAGNYVWARSMNGKSYPDKGMSVGVDGKGNVCVSGSFASDSLVYGSGALQNLSTSVTETDGFVAKIPCTTFSTYYIKACNSYISPSSNYTWTTSGTYKDTIPNNFGCDSVITIHLSIGTVSSSSTQAVTACNSYTSPSGNYSWTSSGVYMDTIPNAVGCDSVMTINLTINISPTATQTVTACNSYTSPSGNYTWSNSGVYLDTLPNPVGCDSIITINLTVNTVDTAVTQTGNVLTANAVSAIYQWLNCDSGFSIITGATNQIFNPTSIGNYAVVITQNGCDDTSACNAVIGVGINETGSLQYFNISPNPVNDVLNVSFNKPLPANTIITISDIQGRMIIEKNTNHTQVGNSGVIPIDVSALSPGVYLLRLDGMVRRFVKL